MYLLAIGADTQRRVKQFAARGGRGGEGDSSDGFGSFEVKRRAEKTGRNISQNITLIIPEHNIPAFKPSSKFVSLVKESLPV